MSEAKVSAICLSLLTPNLAQAATCMDFDKNLNLIEYECDNSIQYSTNDISINSEFADTKVRLILRGAISPINNQSIKIIPDYNPEIGEGPRQSKTFSVDTSYSAGLGVRMAKPNSWFQDIEIGIMQFNGLATRYTQYDKSMTLRHTHFHIIWVIISISG